MRGHQGRQELRGRLTALEEIELLAPMDEGDLERELLWKRPPRLERDETMRRKFRQRAVDGDREVRD